MRVVVAAVMVLGCQTTSDRRPTPLDDPGGPQAAAPACRRWDRGAWLTQDCRLDRVIHGDAARDCIRVVTSREAVRLWVWPRCSGEPIPIVIPRWNERKQQAERQIAIRLPERLRSQAWAHAIGALLVGRERVQCERSSTVCAPPDAMLGWISDTSQSSGGYEPRWQDGEPVLPGAEALVLDPTRDRRVPSDAHRDVSIDLAQAQLVIADQSGLSFEVVASCTRFEVLSSGWLTAVVDRQSKRWSVVLVPGDVGPLADAACREGVVFVPHAIGVDTIALVSIRPDTGRWRDDVPDTKDWRASVASGVIEIAPMVSVRQLEAWLVPAKRAAAECPETTAPLWSIAPDDPCDLRGRGDVDHDGVVDCWRASRLGNLASGVVGWMLELQPSCTGTFDGELIDVNGVVRIARPRMLAPRFVAERLAGAPRCLPATRACAAPDGALRRLLDQYAAHAEGTPSRLRWVSGTPELAKRAAVVVTVSQPGIVVEEQTYVMLYDPPAGELVRGPRCGDFEIWSAPMGGVAIDLARKQWTWAWVASERQHYWNRSLPIVVRSGACAGAIATFALSDGDTAIVDLHTGKSTTIDGKRTAEIEKLGTVGWQQALADARGD